MRQVVKRKKQDFVPPNPDSVLTMDIPIELQALDGQPFIAFDTRVNDGRIIILGTDVDFERLSNCQTW